mgnify:CR=1 FL=1
MKKAISYLRVSTDRQGKSGLGIEAQRTKVAEMVVEQGLSFQKEFLEVQSGKSRKRPQLERALQQCRVTGAILLVPKIDRLARDAAYLMNLYDSGIEVHFGDMPDASGCSGRFMLQIMASVAEYEGRRISERTKDALSVARKRGVRLGGWRGGPAPDWKAGHRAIQAIAKSHADTVYTTIKDMQEMEKLSHRQIARRLTEMGALTPRGSTNWSHVQVGRIMERAA